jgi:hypothetical protein
MSAPATWPEASRRLAARVARRERVGHVLTFLGRGLGTGAVVGLALRALEGAPTSRVAWALAGGSAVGLVLGALRAFRVRAVEPGDAAWALDRRSGARGRGLVAAVVPGAVGAEAAWAEPRIAPPAVRLRPPAGLAPAATAALVAAVALVVPPRAGGDEPRTLADAEGGAPGAVAGDGDAGSAEQRARTAEHAAKARAAERMRDALELARESAADPAVVAERLRDPEVRRAAADAAAGTDYAPFVGDAPTQAEELAQRLVDGARSEDAARAARRDRAAALARAGTMPVPVERRPVVERWFARRSPSPGAAGESAR